MALIRSAWSSYLPSSRDTLVAKVMSLYGIGTDAELEAKAEDFLNEAIDELNTHLWEFNRTREEGIALVASQDYVPLRHEVYKEDAAYLVATNNSGIIQRLREHDFTRLEVAFGGSSNTGPPMAYSFENLFQEGKLYLFPTPDANAVSDWTLTFQYYRRISHLTSQGESVLQVPREAEQMILNHAYARVAAHLKGASDPDVASYVALSSRAFENLKGIDRRQPDNNTRFGIMGGWGPIRLANATSVPYWWTFT